MELEDMGVVARGLDLAVRLPPLYLMDCILIQNLGVWTRPGLVSPVSPEPGLPPTNLTEAMANSSDLYSTFAELYGGSPVLLLLPHIARQELSHHVNIRLFIFRRFSLCSFLYFLSLLVFFLPSAQVRVPPDPATPPWPPVSDCVPLRGLSGRHTGLLRRPQAHGRHHTGLQPPGLVIHHLRGETGSSSPCWPSTWSSSYLSSPSPY